MTDEQTQLPALRSRLPSAPAFAVCAARCVDALHRCRPRPGPLQGTDCFGAFMQSGLPKAALKHIWDLVAGNEPRLK